MIEKYVQIGFQIRFTIKIYLKIYVKHFFFRRPFCANEKNFKQILLILSKEKFYPNYLKHLGKKIIREQKIKFATLQPTKKLKSNSKEWWLTLVH